MEKVEITIVGAGVIGLAVAAELSQSYKDIFVIERNSSFGQEISSRNSEVIHAGIYYPKDSLKAKTCLEGRRLLYEFCQKHNIGYRKTGKLIVACADFEIRDLEELFKRGKESGAEDLSLLSKNQILKIEPHIEAKAAIHSPSTGILDSHGLMKSLAAQLKVNGADIVYNADVVGIDKDKCGFKVYVKDKKEEGFDFQTKVLINCAGLNSDKIAALCGIKSDEYKLKYCKGDYFRVSNNKTKFISRLIYPVPRERGGGLGIHATLDLAHSLRLGPDDEYVKEIDYNVDESKSRAFCEDVGRFLPFLEVGDLSPDTAGIRPKLQGPGEDFRDFLIKDEANRGLFGLINLVGIESPGLTSCLSIAKLVKGMVDRLSSDD